MDIGTAEWIRCPVCGGKTRARHTDAEPMNLWETSQLIGSVCQKE